MRLTGSKYEIDQYRRRVSAEADALGLRTISGWARFVASLRKRRHGVTLVSAHDRNVALVAGARLGIPINELRLPFKLDHLSTLEILRTFGVRAAPGSRPAVGAGSTIGTGAPVRRARPRITSREVNRERVLAEAKRIDLRDLADWEALLMRLNDAVVPDQEMYKEMRDATIIAASRIGVPVQEIGRELGVERRIVGYVARSYGALPTEEVRRQFKLAQEEAKEEKVQARAGSIKEQLNLLTEEAWVAFADRWDTFAAGLGPGSVSDHRAAFLWRGAEFGFTLEFLGDKVGVTGERVRQILMAAGAPHLHRSGQSRRPPPTRRPGRGKRTDQGLELPNAVV